MLIGNVSGEHDCRRLVSERQGDLRDDLVSRETHRQVEIAQDEIGAYAALIDLLKRLIARGCADYLVTFEAEQHGHGSRDSGIVLDMKHRDAAGGWGRGANRERRPLGGPIDGHAARHLHGKRGAFTQLRLDGDGVVEQPAYGLHDGQAKSDALTLIPCGVVDLIESLE